MKFIESTIKVLLEEKKNYMQMKEQYENQINILPKGSIFIKKRNSKEYLYFSCVSDNGKFVNKYIGKNTDSNRAIVQEQLDKRNQLKVMLKNLVKDIETIDKMLKPALKHIQQQSTREKLKQAGAEKGATQTPPYEGSTKNQTFTN
jgi:hypothetical protein